MLVIIFKRIKLVMMGILCKGKLLFVFIVVDMIINKVLGFLMLYNLKSKCVRKVMMVIVMGIN